ncbi:hypothetical protein L1D24_05335 [Vibrio brasiliensis]|uniref:hypothetical protein n=1 Tax=Vibrio brasiliensis TaxID=170652 RepID=UPI001EFDCB34|nr:hypothetical protein [Vibrio brasiliensis]MCG9647992.1 hypothetical protein [Vibrio brasiliensis]
MNAIRIVPEDYSAQNPFEKVVCLTAKPTAETLEPMAVALGYTELYMKKAMNLRWFMVAIDYYQLSEDEKLIFPFINLGIHVFYEWSAYRPQPSNLEDLMILDLRKLLKDEAIKAKYARAEYSQRKQGALTRYRTLLTSIVNTHKQGYAVHTLNGGRPIARFDQISSNIKNLLEYRDMASYKSLNYEKIPKEIAPVSLYEGAFASSAVYFAAGMILERAIKEYPEIELFEEYQQYLQCVQTEQKEAAAMKVHKDKMANSFLYRLFH